MNETPQNIGRYVVRERLGQGGMGLLYLALDPAIDRLVAVKLLGVQQPELRERFVREAGLAGRLQHPNIVTVYDVGTHNGQPFIAMEYIPGETLGELIQRRATLSLRRRLELIVEACQGLAFAHRHGIVHRDIKPANLMVSRESGALKVLDFGIARGSDSSLTLAGMVMGTPNYMSPEQLEGRPLDHRSDVFALGLVLYEVLGYRQAFSGDTPQAVWHQIASAQPPPILEANPEIPEGLVTIVDRAIAKRVEDRYPDLDTLRADLLRVIHRLQSLQSGDTLADVLPVTPPSPTRRPDFARLAERRAAQVATHLRHAEAALAQHDLERAQEAAEEAAMLDTHDPRVLKLLERIRHELDTREVSGLVAEADTALKSGALTSAAGIISRALQLMPSHGDALAFRATLQQAIETRERSQERARQVGRALEQAEAQFAAGALEPAMRATREALGYDPTNTGALDLRSRLQEAVRTRIDEVLVEAQADVAAQRFTAALRRLEQTRPRDERIEALEANVRQTWMAAQDAALAELTAIATPSLNLPLPPPLTAPPPAPPPPATLMREARATERAPTPAPGTSTSKRPMTTDVPAARQTAADLERTADEETSPSMLETRLAPNATRGEPVAVPPMNPSATSPVSSSTARRTPAAGSSAAPPPVTSDRHRVSGAVRTSPPTPRATVANTRPEQRKAQAHDYLQRARALLEVGDFARSLSLVDTALALDPSRAEANDLRRQIDQAWAANELGRPSRSRGAGV
jgi:tetratricopeptide (TPR) repeat protein/predicted Ser/Thr protein kinase